VQPFPYTTRVIFLLFAWKRREHEMLTALRRLRDDRRGNALVIAAGALPLLLGSAGLATDTIQWALWKRQLQRAADSAALAGVYARVQNNSGQTAQQAVDVDLSKNHHTQISLMSGYPQVGFPISTGWTNGVSVNLAIQKSLGFSSLFLSSTPIITAKATAATIATGVYCVVSLEPTSATGITATGNGSIDLGCGMITNSTSLTAAIATGSSEVHATPIAAVGSIAASDNWNGAELLPFTVRQADPFADLSPPSFTPCQGAASRLRVGSNQTVNRSADTGVVCVSDMDLQGDVTLGSATYVIDGGDFDVGAQAKVRCTGCTIILTNSSSGSTATIGTADINGGAQINMSAPTTGTYKGLLFYQDPRASSSSNDVNKINGNSDSLLTGALYFPKQLLQINGTAGLKFRCAQFVSRTVEFSGNGSITNTCTAGYGDSAIMGKHVRLVS
jgi:Flp pilus assembly protein TadG